MYFANSYLRVVSPVTEDGNRPKIVNGMPVYKETALLPQHLRKTIEEVHNEDVQPVVTNQSVKTTERKKPGPKPKSFQ
jgi:hypothetical protein